MGHSTDGVAPGPQPSPWTVEGLEALMERISTIQQQISHRAPTQQLFDAITTACAELIGPGCIVGLRLADEDAPGEVRLVAASGLPAEAMFGAISQPMEDGLAGMAFRDEAIVTREATHLTDATSFVNDVTAAALAAPVHAAGRVVGTIELGVLREDRHVDDRDRHLVRVFADLASLALNDHDAVESVRRVAADMMHRTTHDPLTDLPNRSMVLDRLTFALHRAQRTDQAVTVLFIDLDRFQTVNEVYGHGPGDDALVEVARRLREAVRPADTVGRLGGDEFVVVCEQVPERNTIDLAERLVEFIGEPIILDGLELTLTASIGIAHAAPAETAEEILWNADIAMYRAKETGRARVVVFDDEMRSRIMHRVDMEQALRHAIDRGELRLHFQPAWSLPSGTMLGCEALLRWQRPEHGLVPPAAFVPLAEETGLIVPIGAWVIGEACMQVATWRRDVPELSSMRVSVNLAMRQLTDPGLVDVVRDALASSGLPADALWLEITETTAMEDVATTAAALAELRGLGVRLALDDFGTGYSSLSYLRELPVDIVKIDRSFVINLATDPGSRAIVTAIVHLARALGLDVMAEGVETLEQLEVLRELDCHIIQGFLLGGPEAPEDVLRSLRSGAPAGTDA